MSSYDRGGMAPPFHPCIRHGHGRAGQPREHGQREGRKHGGWRDAWAMGVKVGMRDAGDGTAFRKRCMRGVGAGRERALHGHLYHKSLFHVCVLNLVAVSSLVFVAGAAA